VSRGSSCARTVRDGQDAVPPRQGRGPHREPHRKGLPPTSPDGPDAHWTRFPPVSLVGTSGCSVLYFPELNSTLCSTLYYPVWCAMRYTLLYSPLFYALLSGVEPYPVWCTILYTVLERARRPPVSPTGPVGARIAGPVDTVFHWASGHLAQGRGTDEGLAPTIEHARWAGACPDRIRRGARASLQGTIRYSPLAVCTVTVR
jgi:hypothetical protein